MWPLVGVLIVSVLQMGAGGKERESFGWAVWQAPVAKLGMIPALGPLDSALPSIAKLWMRVSGRK